MIAGVLSADSTSVTGGVAAVVGAGLSCQGGAQVHGQEENVGQGVC